MPFDDLIIDATITRNSVNLLVQIRRFSDRPKHYVARFWQDGQSLGNILLPSEQVHPGASTMAILSAALTAKLMWDEKGNPPFQIPQRQSWVKRLFRSTIPSEGWVVIVGIGMAILFLLTHTHLKR
jgi:hypothetical protein